MFLALVRARCKLEMLVMLPVDDRWGWPAAARHLLTCSTRSTEIKQINTNFSETELQVSDFRRLNTGQGKELNRNKTKEQMIVKDAKFHIYLLKPSRASNPRLTDRI